MSAYPKPNEPRVNNPAGLVLRYQANIRLGADFYFPKEFAQLKRLLERVLGFEKDLSGEEDALLDQAVALFDEIEARYEARVAEYRGLLEGFLHDTRAWLQEVEEAPGVGMRVEQAHCRLMFGNPGAALAQARAAVDEQLAHLLSGKAVPRRPISSLTARSLPLARLFGVLEGARQTTIQQRYLVSMPEAVLQRFAAWMGVASPAAVGEALLVRAVQDRRHVAYLVCLADRGEAWAEALGRLPQWDGAFLGVSLPSDALASEVGLVARLQRLAPRLVGELVLEEGLQSLLDPYIRTSAAVGSCALPVDAGSAKRFVHRMIEGHA